uniref:Uncharacterized protein n=1 Tax=Halimeda discoidea TaxID=118222 RepID=A0A1C9JB60_9CHLO|nr:hypothetical protein [Halimeda discoidea]
MKGKLNAKELTEFLITELLQKRFCTLQSQSVKWKYLKISKGSQTFKYILANTYGTQQEEYYALEKCAVFEIQRQNKEVSSFVTLRGIPKSWLDGVNLPSFDLLEDVFIKSLVIENKLEICYIGSTSRNKRAKIISSTLKRDLQTKEIIKKPIKRKSY